MTLLSICTDAADEIKVTRPGSIVGNASDDARSLYRYANRVGIKLMKTVAWQLLRKERTFTSIAGETQTAILPSDFDRFVPETFWDRSQMYLVSGPVTATQWQGLKATGYSNSCEPKFAYRGGDVLLMPAPGAGNSLAFEYVSSQWAQSSGGTAQGKFLADTDTALLNEELITRGVIFEYLDGEGQPSQKALADFMDFFNTMIENDQPGASIMVSADIFGGGRHFTGAPPPNGGTSVYW